MTNRHASILGNKCSMNLNITDPIPTDDLLTASHTECEIKEAGVITFLGSSDGSCYAEISIDYNTKKMEVITRRVYFANSQQSPYDDMFGFANDIRSIVQYKIEGNLKQNEFKMTTRVQCDTYDNCALDKIRKLLTNLTDIVPRTQTFGQIKNFLISSTAGGAIPMICMTNPASNSNEEENTDPDCSHDKSLCKYERTKEGDVEQSCKIHASSTDPVIEYRFNVLEEAANNGNIDSAQAFKIFFECNKDRCNDKNSTKHVIEMLTSLALVSTTNVQTRVVNVISKNITTQTNHNTNKNPIAHTNPKSNGISLMASIYYRLIIIYSLFITIPSN
ncbi:unnamed protein product [Adineta steineri]|uniref:Uncharacterized protein n=1 Tax=Adineta steineri TaxID=433720 RepID=A0A815QJG0_9BILA|nr:unnamed protein product [Adineta steineri]CAF1464102.1 unnamed protein product [Adineta steineri]